MFTVALIGPDGAGKTTIGQMLEHALPLPVKYMYMGVNLEASNYMLPTTRLARKIKRLRGTLPDCGGPRDPSAPTERPRSLPRRVLREIKCWISLANRVAEEWFRQAVVWYFKLRRNIVVFDRHYYADYHAYDIEQSGRRPPLTRRLHGWLLAHLYPRPDLVIYLDAPPEVLLARKGEGTLALLERRRQDYLSICRGLENSAVVDANRPVGDVAGDVEQQIRKYYSAMRGTS